MRLDLTFLSYIVWLQFFRGHSKMSLCRRLCLLVVAVKLEHHSFVFANHYRKGDGMERREEGREGRVGKGGSEGARES